MGGFEEILNLTSTRCYFDFQIFSLLPPVLVSSTQVFLKGVWPIQHVKFHIKQTYEKQSTVRSTDSFELLLAREEFATSA